MERDVVIKLCCCWDCFVVGLQGIVVSLKTESGSFFLSTKYLPFSFTFTIRNETVTREMMTVLAEVALK